VDRAADRELGDRDDALRLVTDVDEHLVLVHADDGAVHDLPLLDRGEGGLVVGDELAALGVGRPDAFLEPRVVDCLVRHLRRANIPASARTSRRRGRRAGLGWARGRAVPGRSHAVVRGARPATRRRYSRICELVGDDRAPHRRGDDPRAGPLRRRARGAARGCGRAVPARPPAGARRVSRCDGACDGRRRDAGALLHGPLAGACDDRGAARRDRGARGAARGGAAGHRDAPEGARPRSRLASGSVVSALLDYATSGARVAERALVQRPRLGREERLVFVVGCPRSGTTFVGRAIGGLPGFVDFGEVTPWKAALPAAPSAAELRTILERIRRIGLAWGLRGVEQTPETAHVLAAALEAYPQALAVHVVRDGRDVVCSLLERGWLNAEQEGRDDARLPYGPEPRFWVEPERREEFATVSDARRCAWAWRRYVE